MNRTAGHPDGIDRMARSGERQARMYHRRASTGLKLTCSKRTYTQNMMAADSRSADDVASLPTALAARNEPGRISDSLAWTAI